MPATPPVPEPIWDGLVGLSFTTRLDISETLIAYPDEPRLRIRLGRAHPPSAGAHPGRDPRP
jgi:hypothetical protein